MKRIFLLFVFLVVSLPMYGAVVSASRLYAGWNAFSPAVDIKNLEQLHSLEKTGLLRAYLCDSANCYVWVSVSNLELGKGYWIYLDPEALTPPNDFLELVTTAASGTAAEPVSGWNFHFIPSTTTPSWLTPSLKLYAWDKDNGSFRATTAKDVLEDVANFDPAEAYMFLLP
jgi:hypothetical protein